MTTDRLTLEITRLGAHGDGIADTGRGPVFVPLALPGERVLADVDGERGRLADVLQPSPDRIAPVCPHFGSCGACAMQHLARGPYLQWKRDVVVTALRARGLDAAVEPIVATPLASRRRATLAARLAGDRVLLGFHGLRSRDLADIQTCAVLTARIVELLPGLRLLLQPILSRKEEARIAVLDADNGVDLVIAGGRKDLSPATRARASAHAASLGIVRLSLGKEILLQTAEPAVRFDGVSVMPAPGTFLQASKAAETAMSAIITGALGKVRRIADLFSGAGTFTLPLARIAPVLAIDGDAASIEALKRAARHASGLKPIDARVRDIFREPLSPKELEPYDVVVFDPPHAGAKAQSGSIAKSRARVVVAVSCNPATLARDLRTLIDGGYNLEQVVPFDQFVFSAEVEAVAILSRS